MAADKQCFEWLLLLARRFTDLPLRRIKKNANDLAAFGVGENLSTRHIQTPVMVAIACEDGFFVSTQKLNLKFCKMDAER